MTTSSSNFPMLYDYVYLADQAGWERLIQAGWTDDQIVDQVLRYVEPPLSIDDYEVFIGEIRTLPTSVWSELPPT